MSRKLLVILVMIAVLLAGGYLYLRFKLRSGIDSNEIKTVDTLGGKKVSALDLRPLFIERMQQVLKNSSNGLYNLSIGDMQVDVLASNIILQNVKMQPDSSCFDSLKKLNGLPADVYTITFDKLQIEGVNLDDAMTSKTMDYELIKLVRPVIIVHHSKSKDKKNEGNKEDFSQRFLQQMQMLSIKKLSVEEGEIHVYNQGEKKASNTLRHVSVQLNNVLVDSTSRNDKQRFLFAKDGRLSFKDYIKPSKDGLYQLKISEAVIQSNKQVVLKGFSFTSPLTKNEFVKRQEKSKELYNLVLPSLTISNVDWWTLLNEEEITADEIKAGNGKLSIYLDRSLPPKNKMGNFPSQLIMKMPVKLNIEKLSVNDLDFSYEEYNPISQQSGTVYFDKVNLDVANISNVEKKRLAIKGNALFMHKVPLKADFVFDMKAAKTGKFSVQMEAEGFDATLINSFTVPMGLMKIEKGNVEQVKATVAGDQWQANGDMSLLYKELKLALMEKDKGEKALDKKGFTSFVANLFVIKKDNEGSSPRKTNASFKRIPEGGFFMLIWKTMLVGILKTIGAPEKIAYKTVASSTKK